jgi:hypothetical protein
VTIELKRLDLANRKWAIVSSIDVADCRHEVPTSSGHYLWISNGSISELPETEPKVLYVGQSSNLKGRLTDYCGYSYKREDPVLRALFERVIAPELPPDVLKAVVVDRKSPAKAQEWIRHQVTFGWSQWDDPGRGKEENRLKKVLQPEFNGSAGWTSFGALSPEQRSVVSAVQELDI